MPWGSAADIDYARSGIPTEAEFVAAYCAAAGRDGVADWSFLLSFSAFRLAAIAQGVYVRRQAASPDVSVINGAPQWAELAWSLLD
jgi:aminoglycoside phosphotransferase (APT) family kinase protein